MKKKLIIVLSLVMAMVLCLGCLAACKKGLSTEQLDALYKQFQKEHKNDETETPVSYYVSGKVTVYEEGDKEISAKVKWTIEGSSAVTIGETNHMGNVQIVVPDDVTDAINYKLIGTLVDDKDKEYENADGKPYKIELAKTVPGGKGHGTEDSPYSVTVALAENAAVPSGGFSAEKFYVKGIVVTVPTYNTKYQSYSFWIADSKDAAKRLQVYSGTLASGIAKVSQNDTVVVHGFYMNYNASNPEMTGSSADPDKGVIAHDYPVITSRTIGTSEVTFTPNENADIVLSKTSGQNGDTFTFTVTVKNGANLSSVKVNGTEVTATSGNTYTGTIDGDTDVSVIALVPTTEEQTVTVNLATDFATYSKDWGTGYKSRTLDSNALNVKQINMILVLSRGSVQNGTVTDIPVMAAQNNTQYVTLSVEDCQINAITFNLREWSNSKKFKTVCLEYTTDGTTWVEVDGVGFVNASPEKTIGSGFATLSVNELTSGVKAVRLVIATTNSQNQQVGIEGFTVKTGPYQQPVVDNSVCRIGSTSYDTLEAAIEAAKANDEIVLKKDIVIDAQINLGKSVTLNLNGHTISNTVNVWVGSGDNVTANSMLSIQDGANVVINGNGKILAKQDDAYAINIVDGTLVIENGEFVGNITAVQVQKGTATIKGGKFSILQLSTLSHAGPYDFMLNCIDKAYEGKTANIVVEGGEFVNFDPANNKAEGAGTTWVKTGYESTSKTEGSNTIFKVVKALPVTKVDVTNLQEGTEYVLVMNQENAGKAVYLTGGFDGFYGASTDDVTKAAKIYIEKVDGGVKIAIGSGADKKYLGFATYKDGNNTRYNLTIGGKIGSSNGTASDIPTTAENLQTSDVWTITADKISITAGTSTNHLGTSNTGTYLTFSLSNKTSLFFAFIAEVNA